MTCDEVNEKKKKKRKEVRILKNNTIVLKFIIIGVIQGSGTNSHSFLLVETNYKDFAGRICREEVIDRKIF